MIQDFRLPDLGEGLPEAELVQWLVAEGDTVAGLELQDNQQLLEDRVKAWLRARISEIETRREVEAAASRRIF